MSLVLREGGLTRAVPLTTGQARALAEIPKLVSSLLPRTEPGTFDVVVGNRVGAVQVAGLDVVITPKLPIAPLMWLVGYAATGVQVQTDAQLQPSTWIEAFAAVYADMTHHAVAPGLLRGYWTMETTDTTLRGRLRLPEQIRRHHGRLHPLELTYEEHGIDIAENQILKGALDTLLTALTIAHRPTPQHATITRKLQHLRQAFTGVTPLTPGAPIPPWRASQLNERYHHVLALSELILTNQGLDPAHGGQHAKGFLIDTPAVFERAFTRALHHCLQQHRPELHVEAQRSDQYITGDTGHHLRPDIAITHNNTVVTVLDTKYKTADPKPGDIYQMHAYASYYQVNNVHLIYAEPLTTTPHELHIKGTHTTIHRHGINLHTPHQDFHDQVNTIATSCRL